MAFDLATNVAIARAALDDDAVQVVINGTSYQQWMEIDIDSDILTPADAFTVTGEIPKAKPTVAESRAGSPSRAFDDFREGNSCDIYVGLDRQMAGVIDEVTEKGGRSSARITITGRDKGAFLLDDEAKAIKASKYTLKTLVEALLDPSWGIRNVLLSNEDNRALLLGKKDKKKPRASAPRFLQPLSRDRTKVDPGSRVASILDKHTRRLGVAWWLTAQGDLVIAKPNYDQEAAYHFYSYAPDSANAKQNNVEDWSRVRSISERFSDITVNGQGWSDPTKLWSGTATKPKFTATARDPDLVERGIVRKLILADGDALTQDEVQKRADWEMGMRRIRGEVIKLIVPGFRQGDRLFAIDTLATVKIEEIDIDDTYYVIARRFTENRNRRRTELTLVQKGVWLS